MELQGKRVLVTGVGLKPVGHIFYDKITGKPTHTAINANGKEYKANIGTAVALECLKNGATVVIVGQHEEKLAIVKNWLEEQVGNAKVEYHAMNLNNKDEQIKLVNTIPDDLPLYWVHSLGLGAGTVNVKEENPYLPIEEVYSELMQGELSVLTSTLNLTQVLLPRFRKQKETRVCIISSMSAIRGYPQGTIHTAAKAALSRFVNAARFELDKDCIYLTDVRPGMVDTGGYDARSVQEAMFIADKAFGTNHKGSEDIYLMPPTAIGKLVANALSSESNILSINVVARGQEFVEAS